MSTKLPGIRVIDSKKPVSISAGQRKVFVRETGKTGRLRYVVVNFQEATQLELHVTIDGQDVLSRTSEEVSAAQNNCLGIQANYGAGGMLQCQVYTTNNYGIVLDLNANPIEFAKELLIEVRNRHATVAYSTQALYGLYEID